MQAVFKGKLGADLQEETIAGKEFWLFREIQRLLWSGKLQVPEPVPDLGFNDRQARKIASIYLYDKDRMKAGFTIS